MSKAIAILFSGDPDSGECNMDIFREADFPNPWKTAESMRDSCAPDFPNRMWAITGSDAARKIRSKSRLSDWGL